MGIIEDRNKAFKAQDEIMKSFYGNEATPELVKRIEHDIEKGGKRAVMGEERLFGGKKYRKTSDGWRPVGKGESGRVKLETGVQDKKDSDIKHDWKGKPIEGGEKKEEKTNISIEGEPGSALDYAKAQDARELSDFVASEFVGKGFRVSKQGTEERPEYNISKQDKYGNHSFLIMKFSEEQGGEYYVNMKSKMITSSQSLADPRLAYQNTSARRITTKTLTTNKTFKDLKGAFSSIDKHMKKVKNI